MIFPACSESNSPPFYGCVLQEVSAGLYTPSTSCSKGPMSITFTDHEIRKREAIGRPNPGRLSWISYIGERRWRRRGAPPMKSVGIFQCRDLCRDTREFCLANWIQISLFRTREVAGLRQAVLLLLQVARWFPRASRLARCPQALQAVNPAKPDTPSVVSAENSPMLSGGWAGKEAFVAWPARAWPVW